MPFDAVIDGYFLTEPPTDDIRQRQSGARAASGRHKLAGGCGSAIFGDEPPTIANYRAGLARWAGDKADALFALYPAEPTPM